ncbi:MAG TPA: YmdB family metallophosphoesterase [Spirochaetia bacterium]|nr:YmdB family metallophosphoesterase [Spirochaetia bacterium]
MEPLRLLFIGEIVGKCGVFCVKKLLPKLKAEKRIDFVIANGDGATGGFGIGKNHSIYLHKLGVNVITGGDCIYFKRDMVEHIAHASYILRAANYPYGNPGRGVMVYQTPKGPVGVVSLLGLAGFDRIHLSNPFLNIKSILEKLKNQTNRIVIDFHAATTSEKYTMFHYLGGEVSAIIGTHAKALTADARIVGEKTAVICDAGRTGNSHSVGGFDSIVEIRKFLTQIPEHSQMSCEHLELQGVVVDIDEEGNARQIETVKERCEEVFHEGDRTHHSD